MAYGFNRFLTTHTGSLPRPDDLIRAMFAKEEGVPVDGGALAARVRAAVAEVAKKQVEAGVDLVNDGEMSKPSYATYVKDRLTGFSGSSNTFVYQDLAEFPNLAKRVFSDPGRSRRRTPACTGPIGVGDPAAPLADIDNLKAAVAGGNAVGMFLGAASPGVISLFFRNDHYANQEAYLFAIAEAMPRRVRGDRRGRGHGADRLPGPGDGSAHPIRRLVRRGIPQAGAAPYRGAEPCAGRDPAGARADASVLGQLRGTAPSRRAARRDH